MRQGLLVKDEQDEPSKDQLKDARQHREAGKFKTKVLGGSQWRAGEYLLRIALRLASVNARRGSTPEAEYMLSVSGQVAEAVRSQIYSSRVAAQQAEMLFRRRQFDGAEMKLEEAVEMCPLDEGPDMVEIKRVRGDLLARLQMVKEARHILTTASKDVHGLDAVFNAAEALLPSPRKGALAASAAKSLILSTSKNKEPLLPIALAQILQRQGMSCFTCLKPDLTFLTPSQLGCCEKRTRSKLATSSYLSFETSAPLATSKLTRCISTVESVS